MPTINKYLERARFSKINNIHNRRRLLEQAREELKQKFIGIDYIIDELISYIKIWYLMPELMRRPLIVNLWGMTGVGKTDLIRDLVKLLDFQDKFIEVEMNNSSQSGFYRHSSSVSEIITDQNLDPAEPFIMMFDEIQRFRTIDEHGIELQDTRFQDFWELLSDGKLAKRRKGDIEDNYQELLYFSKLKQQKPKNTEDNEEPEEEISRVGLWQAGYIKKTFGLKQSVADIAMLTEEELLEELISIKEDKKIYEEHKFEKALIIISGNLDEAYNMAGEISEADVDADIFHNFTLKISLVDIKQALARRFKPEQVARFGNIHIIYRSLKKKDFQRLIQLKIDDICRDIFSKFDVSVKVDPSLLELIYTNGVFPVQGTRPVFSTITDIFETNLTNFLFHALVGNYNTIQISYDKKQKNILAKFSPKESLQVGFVGKVDKVRQSNQKNTVTLVSVHEAGHAVAYAVLFGLAPLQLKSRVASAYAGGFVFPHQIYSTKKNILDEIVVLLAGGIAEALVFGQDNISVGRRADWERATSLASDYVRIYGFTENLKSVYTTERNDKMNTEVVSSNLEIEQIIKTSEERAQSVLKQNKKFLIKIADLLRVKGELLPKEFIKIAKDFGVSCRVEKESYLISPDYVRLFKKT